MRVWTTKQGCALDKKEGFAKFCRGLSKNSSLTKLRIKVRNDVLILLFYCDLTLAFLPEEKTHFRDWKVGKKCNENCFIDTFEYWAPGVCSCRCFLQNFWFSSDVTIIANLQEDASALLKLRKIEKFLAQNESLKKLSFVQICHFHRAATSL